MSTFIASERFESPLELASALQSLVATAQSLDQQALVFATSDGFSRRGVAGLREDPPRGGSKVYEIVLMGEAIV